ncbi:unnamed protein product [Urochloa humidicola]
MRKMQKTGTTRDNRAPTRQPTPHLTEEIILEILAWLPVKTLLRFRSVCKAWRATISDDPVFIRAHLRHSATKWEQDPTFIITPLTVIPDESRCRPKTFSTHFRFYQWQPPPLQQQQHGGTAGTSPSNSNENVGQATFLDAKDFPRQFNTLRFLTQCDGLVFAPTNTRLYLFNPATRDAITLPDSDRNNLRCGTGRCYAAGIGLDPSTGSYKVVQAFYRSPDPDTTIGKDMGMEVFTVASDSSNSYCGAWREIARYPPLPYPVKRVQTALAVCRFMFWRLAERDMERQLRGILYLSLDDEKFDVCGLPDDLDLEDDDDFMLDVLHGRDLCVSASNRRLEMLTIWTLPIADEGLCTLWVRRYSIPFSGLCRLMALPPFTDGRIVLWQASTLYCFDLETCELKILCDLRRMRYQKDAGEWENLFTFSVQPFTESIIRINSRRQSNTQTSVRNPFF